jgi:hypothetical protein
MSLVFPPYIERAFTIEINNFSLEENAKTNTLHFTLELEGQRDRGSLNDTRVYLASYTTSKGRCFHGLLDFTSSPPQRGGSSTKVGDHMNSKSYNP